MNSLNTWHRFTIAAVACAAGLTLACSGKTVDTGGDGGGSSGGATSACDDYFDVAFGGSCPGTLDPPAAEVASLKTRFETLCEADLALPGVTLTASSLETCVSAIKAGGCGVLEQQTGPCAFYVGTLAAGASCVTDSQCLTGSCSAGVEEGDGGMTVLCGTCEAAIPIGQPCTGGAVCGVTAACVTDGTTGTATCVAITYGGAGATCNGTNLQCSAGFNCNESQQCEAPAPAGTPCQSDFECASPLVCPAVTGMSTCQAAGAVGAPCESAVAAVRGGNLGRCGRGLQRDHPVPRGQLPHHRHHHLRHVPDRHPRRPAVLER
jgi:hypothetical protein